MKHLNRTLCLGLLSACVLLLATSNAWAGRLTKCKMTYDLSGWSLAVKVHRGEGVIACDNGQRARVDLYAQAIGLTIGRSEIIDGTGSQTGSARWGDYTAMTVDPVDDCTFWYVNQYLPNTSSVGWRLRIGAFKFDECVSASGIFADDFEGGNTSAWTNTVPDP